MLTEAQKWEFRLTRRMLSPLAFIRMGFLVLWYCFLMGVCVCVCLRALRRHDGKYIKMYSLNTGTAGEKQHERSIFRYPWDIYTVAGNWSHYYTIISISNCSLWIANLKECSFRGTAFDLCFEYFGIFMAKSFTEDGFKSHHPECIGLCVWVTENIVLCSSCRIFPCVFFSRKKLVIFTDWNKA